MNIRTTLAFFALTAASLAAAPVQVPMPSATRTTPATAPALNAQGQIVITFPNAETNKPVPSVMEKGVTFALASPPQTSRAVGRVMFFPHLKTDKMALLNAMANEQGIPVKVTFPSPASSITLVLFGSIGSHALVEAYDQSGKLVNSASLPGTVPERNDPAKPIPSFELTVKAPQISYILFGGAPNGGYLAMEELRYIPALGSAPAGSSTTPTTAPAR